jgi:hypothetical protein
MCKLFGNKLLYLFFFVNCATYTQPVAENTKKDIKILEPFYEKRIEFSAKVKEFSEIFQWEMDQYRAIVSSSCSIEGAKKVGEIDFPFYEKERLEPLENKSYFCQWNFRKEILQFKIQDSISGQILLNTFWYENFPSSIQVFYPEKNLSITRSWQWSVFRTIWEPTFVYLEFDDKKTNHRTEYYFSRYTGSIVRKKEFLIQGKNSIEDGWFYNYDDKIEEDHCHLFKEGKVISKDKNLCEFPLF